MQFGAASLVTALAVLFAFDQLLFGTGLAAYVSRAEPPIESAHVKLLMAPRFRDTATLFVGDSRVASGINPEAISSNCRCGAVYNAGIGGTDPRLTRIVAGRLLDLVQARVMVISVSPWELNDQTEIEVAERAAEFLPAWQVLQFGRPKIWTGRHVLDVALVGTWQLYTNRLELRNAIAAGRPSSDAEFQRGWQPLDRTATQRAVEDQLNTQSATAPPSWTVDLSSKRVAALAALIADARVKSIQPVLVSLPLHPLLADRARPELRQFQDALSSLAEHNGVPLLDFSAPAWLRQEHMADLVHMNRPGATELGTRLGIALSGL